MEFINKTLSVLLILLFVIPVILPFTVIVCLFNGRVKERYSSFISLVKVIYN